MSEWWNRLRAHLRSAKGIDLPASMRIPAQKVLAKMRSDSLDEAVDMVIDSASRTQDIIDVLSVGLTWFHREPEGVNAMLRHLREHRPPDTQQRIWLWSAGCSSGQEPYSLAIQLMSAGYEPQILATDFNREHLRIAQEGIYDEHKLAGVPKWQREQFMEELPAGRWRFKDNLRRCIVYELHNLATGNLPPTGWNRFDAVVCRNVLIYYNDSDSQRIARGLLNSCSQNGCLLLGMVERGILRQIDNELDVVDGLGIPKSLQISTPTKSEPLPSPTRGRRRTRRRTTMADIYRSGDPRLPSRLHASPPDGAALISLATDNPLSATLQLAAGITLWRSRNHTEAIPFLRAAEFLEDMGWLATYYIALCQKALGNRDEARDGFKRTLQQIDKGVVPWPEELPIPEDLDVLGSEATRECQKQLE